MKKFFLSLLSVVFAAGVHAQEIGGTTVAKVDVDKLKSAIAKSDAEIADAKKTLKSATWVKRGDVFVEAESKPVSGLYMGMPESFMKLSFGDAAPREETIGDRVRQFYPYEHFKAYVSNGMIDFYVPTTVVDPQALDKAYDAYAKAYEMDAKTAKKVLAGMESIRNRSVENGGAYYSLGNYAASADNFRRAYRASTHPAVGKIDTMSLYYAGMASVWAEDFPNAVRDLDKAIEMGWVEDGEAYRLKFLAMYNAGEREPALEVLKKGLSLYPANEDIIDIMMKYYNENDGDASSMIPIVEDAIKNNPSNPSLYQGLGQIYDKLGQSDKAIEAIKNAVRLAPEDFFAHYLEGYFYTRKADSMYEALNNMSSTSRTQYQEALAAANAVYAQAVAPLEKAYEINKTEISTVEFLKEISFRLRDDAAMNEKFQKYDALFKSMQAATPAN